MASKLEHDPNAASTEEVFAQLKLAEKLAVKWKCKISMVPLDAYGVEWVMSRDEDLVGLLFFDNGKKDDPYRVRASRLMHGTSSAFELGVPLVGVLMRGPNTRYFRIAPDAPAARPYPSPLVLEIRPGVSEVFVEVDENILKEFAPATPAEKESA